MTILYNKQDTKIIKGVLKFDYSEIKNKFAAKGTVSEYKFQLWSRKYICTTYKQQRALI